MKPSIFWAFALLLLPTGYFLLPAASPVLAFEFNSEYIISDYDLTNPFTMDINQIQQFLERGYLGSYVTSDSEGVQRTAADIIWRSSQFNGVNPRFLLVLLQKEQSLIEDDNPSDRQLDWATGYAVCDSCSKDDPAIARWKGFGKQVNSAALQFTEGYLTDIEETGSTQGKYGPGIPVQIDNSVITPNNAATASLYAYTPHIEGNKNFATIWHRWFSVQYPTGSLLKDAESSAIYLIEYGYKRPINSYSALLSRFNDDLIIEVAPTQLANYPDGRPIDFPNYSLLKDDNGRVYLLVDDALRHIDSMETFYAIGFAQDEIVSIGNTDLASFDTGSPITSATLYPQGNLLELEGSGAIYFIQDGFRHAVLDSAILSAQFPNQLTEKVLPIVVEQFVEGQAVKMPDGWLVKGSEEPVVYVISEGHKRPIENENAFLSMGFEWTVFVE
jgi:hypothetical protein